MEQGGQGSDAPTPEDQDLPDSEGCMQEPVGGRYPISGAVCGAVNRTALLSRAGPLGGAATGRPRVVAARFPITDRVSGYHVLPVLPLFSLLFYCRRWNVWITRWRVWRMWRSLARQKPVTPVTHERKSAVRPRTVRLKQTARVRGRAGRRPSTRRLSIPFADTAPPHHQSVPAEKPVTRG